MRIAAFLLFAVLLSQSVVPPAFAQDDARRRVATTTVERAAPVWRPVETGGAAHERHENAFVRAGDRFYLVGGRGLKPVDVYDPATRTWTQGAQPPIEVHHFQAVELDGLVVVSGALTGPWPFEIPAPNLLLYDPAQDRWIIGPEIPEHRRRGAAGAVVHDGLLYLVGGIVNGHRSHWVPWFDAYDPATNTWHELPDAPRARDHFQAAVIDGRLYAAAGRRSGAGETGFSATISEVDVFDFATQTWTTLDAPLPTERAGTTVAVRGHELLVMGGESASQEQAHAEVEALDTRTGTWRTLPPLATGRHGTQAVPTPEGLYLAGGCARRGGSPEIVALEFLPNPDASPLAPVGARIEPGTLTLLAAQPLSPNAVEAAFTNAGGNQALVVSYALVHGGGAAETAVGTPYILRPGGVLRVKATRESPESALMVRAFGPGAPVEVPLGEVTEARFYQPVHGMTGDVLAVEAEEFAYQTNADVRAWHRHAVGAAADVPPDPDGNHADGASGGAYLEILPDTRTTHDDPLVHGVSFSNAPGRMGVLTYYMHIDTPGTYYVWVRTHTSGTEDNGVHVGLDGAWPASGQRMQFDGGKEAWSWESRQRTDEVHTGVEELIFLEIGEPGVHTVSFSMREDGFEFDKWVLDRVYRKPEGEGPATRRLTPGVK